MKKLSLTEVKRRIRNHEALPDDVVKWYPKLMSRYTIRKVKRNPRGFTGKESRPRLKRYGKGEYRRSARSKELYPRAYVKNPKSSRLRWRQFGAITGHPQQDWDATGILGEYNVKRSFGGFRLTIFRNHTQESIGTFETVNEAFKAAQQFDKEKYVQPNPYSSPSRISRIKSHVKAHLDKDQRDFQREIDEDDELKMWLEKNPKFSASQRRKYAASGVALPDGSFPIRNRKDLMDALHDLGRTKHYAAAKRHIIKRARALGLTADLNPEWVRRKGKKHNPKLYRRMRNGDLVLAQ